MYCCTISPRFGKRSIRLITIKQLTMAKSATPIRLGFVIAVTTRFCIEFTGVGRTILRRDFLVMIGDEVFHALPIIVGLTHAVMQDQSGGVSAARHSKSSKEKSGRSHPPACRSLGLKNCSPSGFRWHPGPA